MNSLLKMLPMMLRLSGDNEEVREQAAFVAWRVTAGPQVAYNCVPFRLYQKRLVIAALDLAWKNQMERLSGPVPLQGQFAARRPLRDFHRISHRPRDRARLSPAGPEEIRVAPHW